MIHSFLLIGQSNMAGRGYLKDAKDIDTSHILVLRNGRWEKMYRPVNNDRPFSGVCLAESFAEKYAEKYGVDVGLIPCADGGTTLDQWKEGSLLYDHAVYQARLASRTSTIAGVLWHQGEADCDITLAETYTERFKIFMAALRRDLDLYDVPFLLGGLGDFLSDCKYDEKLKNYTAINEHLQNLAKENAMTGFVPADELGANPDNLHFNADALYDFGIRYFDEFEKIRDPKKVFPEKPGVNEALRSGIELL